MVKVAFNHGAFYFGIQLIVFSIDQHFVIVTSHLLIIPDGTSLIKPLVILVMVIPLLHLCIFGDGHSIDIIPTQIFVSIPSNVSILEVLVHPLNSIDKRFKMILMKFQSE